MIESNCKAIAEYKTSIRCIKYQTMSKHWVVLFTVIAHVITELYRALVLVEYDHDE